MRTDTGVPQHTKRCCFAFSKYKVDKINTTINVTYLDICRYTPHVCVQSDINVHCNKVCCLNFKGKECGTCMNFSKALSKGSGLFEKMLPSKAFSCWQYSARTRSRISEEKKQAKTWCRSRNVARQHRVLLRPTCSLMATDHLKWWRNHLIWGLRGPGGPPLF